MKICARPGCTAAGIPKYCTRRCSAIDHAHQRGSQLNHATARIAGEAAKRVHMRKAYVKAASMHPTDAYTLGYRTGYRRAYAHWKHGRRLETK